MMLTPKDKRTLLDALVHAEALMSDRIAACPLCRGRQDCPYCKEALDKQNEYRDLAARMRAAS